MRFLISIILFISSFCAVSQQVGKINFDQIKRNITDKKSQYYYPTLIHRILANDSTLTHKDYKYLYYGSVFQDNYHPYGDSFSKKEFSDIYATGNNQNIIEKGILVLQENPVDIEVTLKVLLAYLAEGDTTMARVYGKKYYSFLDVIYASGDGESMETAYVVVSVSDEYRIVGDLNLSVKEQYLIDDCDLLIFEKKGQRRVRGKKIKQLYFNVHMPLMSLSNSFKDVELPEADPDDEEEEEEQEEEE